MVAELARVRFFVEALKSGDSSYPKNLAWTNHQSFMGLGPNLARRQSRSVFR
jgi:hypothetical protein